jgi:RNA polymerase sigma-70 factor (ECF subfamily)
MVQENLNLCIIMKWRNDVKDFFSGRSAFFDKRTCNRIQLYPYTPMSDNGISSKEEFRELFEVYGKKIFRYIYIRAGNSHAVAEDITQDVFERVWDNRKKYDPQRSSVQTWIYTIARNRLTDHYREKHEVPIKPEEEPVSSGENDDVTDAEDVSMVYEAMGYLSEKDRELLTLRYIDDMDLREVAEILNMEYNAAKVAAHRALKRLRNHINGKDQ